MFASGNAGSSAGSGSNWIASIVIKLPVRILEDVYLEDMGNNRIQNCGLLSNPINRPIERRPWPRRMQAVSFAQTNSLDHFLKARFLAYHPTRRPEQYLTLLVGIFPPCPQIIDMSLPCWNSSPLVSFSCQFLNLANRWWRRLPPGSGQEPTHSTAPRWLTLWHAGKVYIRWCWCWITVRTGHNNNKMTTPRGAVRVVNLIKK